MALPLLPMRSLLWAQATADSADCMIHLATSRVLYKAYPTSAARDAACEAAKIEVGKEVVRASTKNV